MALFVLDIYLKWSVLYFNVPTGLWPTPIKSALADDRAYYTVWSTAVLQQRREAKA